MKRSHQLQVNEHRTETFSVRPSGQTAEEMFAGVVFCLPQWLEAEFKRGVTQADEVVQAANLGDKATHHSRPLW